MTPHFHINTGLEMIENYVMLAEWLAKQNILFNINQKAAGINYNYHGACSILDPFQFPSPIFHFTIKTMHIYRKFCQQDTKISSYPNY